MHDANILPVWGTGVKQGWSPIHMEFAHLRERQCVHVHFFKNRITLDTDECYGGNKIDRCGRVMESSCTTFNWEGDLCKGEVTLEKNEGRAG